MVIILFIVSFWEGPGRGVANHVSDGCASGGASLGVCVPGSHHRVDDNSERIFQHGDRPEQFLEKYFLAGKKFMFI